MSLSYCASIISSPYLTHPSLGLKNPSKMIKSQFFDHNSMNTKSYTYLKLIIDVKYSVQFAF